MQKCRLRFGRETVGRLHGRIMPMSRRMREVRIMSAMNDDSKAQINALAEELTKEYVAQNS